MRRTVLLAILLLVAVAAVVLPGNPRLTLPGRLHDLSMTRDEAFLHTLTIPEAERHHIAAQGSGLLYVPPGVDTPADRVLLVSEQMSANFDAVATFGRWIAEDVDALVVGVEVPRHDEDHWGQYYYARHLLRDLVADGRVTTDAKVVLAGFAGGGNVSLIHAAFGGTEAWHAVLAAGVWRPVLPTFQPLGGNDSAFDLPIVLFIGERDTRVAAHTPDLLETLHDHGYRNARAEWYDGDHVLPVPPTIAILDALFEE